MANDSYFQFHYDNERNNSIWRTLMAGYANENSTGFKYSNTWRSTFISVLIWINCRCTTHSWNYQICVLVVFNWYVLNGYWCYWILFINWKHECHAKLMFRVFSLYESNLRTQHNTAQQPVLWYILRRFKWPWWGEKVKCHPNILSWHPKTRIDIAITSVTIWTET